MPVKKIDYTPPETVKEFIKSHQMGKLFYDWIVGPVGPLSGDSEFLTPSGWKRIDAYVPGDMVAQWEPDGERLRFVEPDGYIVGDADSLIHFHNKHSLSMVLSANHRLVYFNERGEVCEAPAGYVAEHKSKRRIPTTFDPVDRPGVGLSEPLIRLAVAIHADGHFPSANPSSTAHPSACHIVVRRERKKARLRLLLDACGVEYTATTYPRRPTETIFKFRSPYIGKHYDARWWGATGAELEVILGEMTYWDGLHEGPDTRFSTTSKADADFMQYAAHACGGRATVKAYNDPRNPEWATVYTVHVAPRGSAKATVYVGEGTKVESVSAPGGKQYCFKTSSTYFLARHDGRVFVTGNSGKTTGIFFKLITLARQQAPSPDGIRRTRAVIVRNTMPQLKDTTLVSWNLWFKDGEVGTWNATDKIFTIRCMDIECAVMFRPLDTPQDVARVLSLEINFAILDEFVEMPKAIIDALSARCGRYKQPDGTPVTIWGMWGSSNPSTEDNWWYDYLHSDAMIKWDKDPKVIEKQIMEYRDKYNAEPNATYFHQPSALSDEAENIPNLPGHRGYYTEVMKGKGDPWVKQFVEAQWGFSISGQPVVSQFREELHVAKRPLVWNKHKPLIVAFDPGITGSAFLFGQEDYDGRLYIFKELVQEGYGAQRLIEERLIPVLRQDFRGADVIIVPDPAANNRTPTDEGTVVKVFKKYFTVECETNNRFPLRLNAIEHFTSKIIAGVGAVQIDKAGCPVLIRALKGGWRYTADIKKDILKGADPEKNPFSHVGDTFGYLCRYFHKDILRNEKYGRTSTSIFKAPPRGWKPPNYHAR